MNERDCEINTMHGYQVDVYEESEDFYDISYDADDPILRYYDWRNVYGSCVLPCLHQISHYVMQFIIANMIFCLGSKIRARYMSSKHSITHLLSIGCGCYLLYNTVEYGLWYWFLLFFSAYLLFKVSHIVEQWFGFEFVISGYCILYLVTCEIVEKNANVWHHIRGILMIAVMKIISLAIDIRVKRHIKEQFSILGFLGYVCCPANCIFGPWSSFGEYLPEPCPR
ncbi:protein-serine O-palmitoleoyltransferase porcupine isoform X2 [Topomyia yanbarensis]|uniref:protein-serine O-palmitoleoyltransferase porcupine isoform X2 n=1 Tax=Topomyia yanbarensis TaxID=2498891 RepID=UPI00273BAE52|nr:protein-serine O-palmitoleoyltransferase porcupine isoform X2 [Topomyia yanbarensis]